MGFDGHRNVLWNNVFEVGHSIFYCNCTHSTHSILTDGGCSSEGEWYVCSGPGILPILLELSAFRGDESAHSL